MPNICPDCFKEGYAFGRCPLCGYIGLVREKDHMVLCPGMLLNNRYLVGRVLGAGGFGITYLVRDDRSGGRMAAKEYLPAAFAVRDGHRLRISSDGGAGFAIYRLRAPLQPGRGVLVWEWRTGTPAREADQIGRAHV